jgi:hypothetical protein
MDKLASLLQKWHQYEPGTCISYEGKWLIAQDGWNFQMHPDFPGDTARSEMAYLQQAIQVEIALKGWGFGFITEAGTGLYEARLHRDRTGILGSGKNTDPAIAMLSAYCNALDVVNE